MTATRAYILAAFVFILDQLSKLWVVNGLELERLGSVPLIPSLSLTWVENTGVDDLLTQVTKWSLLAGERVTICRLRVLIHRDEFLARDDRTSIQGTLALNISSEPHLMRVPFEFTPRRDVVYAVEKLLEFEDMANTRDKRTKHLHIFNARKTAPAISVYVLSGSSTMAVELEEATRNFRFTFMRAFLFNCSCLLLLG